ncbi:MAG: GGDEF domain-containing protein, partial [bacterium]|jgi:diguanylate cyclase (GGDEF)-like protein|nr:GGDEF domain-containing protein [bacterium]
VRNQTALSLLFCDVDFFKNFNDHYGHLAGDECLKMVANLLQQQVKRPGDLFARYGGEEFVILLADTHIAQATSFAEKLCSLVEEKAWPHDMSMIRPVVTVSIGIASVVPSAGLLPERLIQAADKGLYLAKNSGRNRAVACEVPCDSCPDAAE